MTKSFHIFIVLLKAMIGLILLFPGLCGLIGSDPANAVTGFKRLALSMLFIYALLALFPASRVKGRKFENLYIGLSFALVAPFLIYVLFWEFRYWGPFWVLFLLLIFSFVPTSIISQRSLRKAEMKNEGAVNQKDTPDHETVR